MKEVYRKFGRVVRREDAVLIRAEEAGEAWEDGDAFGCYPVDSVRELPDLDVDAVNATADAIRRLYGIERVIVSDGVAFHEFGGISWSERTRRIHVWIAGDRHRAFIGLADFNVAIIERVARAMKHLEVRELAHYRVAENVGAWILPLLSLRIAVQQWAAPHDGKGQWIENRRVVMSEEPPNWWRPSYRARPVRKWFHRRADDFGEIDESLPVAIASTSGGFLCVDGERSFLTPAQLDNVRAVRSTNTWYPQGAGCFGAELVL